MKRREEMKKREMKKFMECGEAIAEAVALCKPSVVAAYPITPQTHIVENLAEIISQGKLKAEFINAESEHSALSICIGAEACGERTFTASSSQGIALMHEMLFIASGLRLPIVMAITNRALSAPINIWCDHSDTLAQRDSGWLQFYCESVQEAYDTIIQAYKISEKIMLPAIVCVDGFTLSHVSETLYTLKEKEVDSFLPCYKPKYKLNTSMPITMGPIAYPNSFMEFKFQQQQAMEEALTVIKETDKEFKNKFARNYGNGLIETYRTEDANIAIIAIGSVCGTIREVIDEMRKKGKKIGLIKLKTFRPFASEELKKVCKSIESIGVIDRAISPGSKGIIYSEVKPALPNLKINNFIAGLGGRDITKKHIMLAIKNIGKKDLWLK